MQKAESLARLKSMRDKFMKSFDFDREACPPEVLEWLQSEFLPKFLSDFPRDGQGRLQLLLLIQDSEFLRACEVLSLDFGICLFSTLARLVGLQRQMVPEATPQIFKDLLEVSDPRMLH